MTSNRLLASLAIAVSLACASAPTWAQSKKDLVAKVLKLQQVGVEGLANTLANNTANQVLQAAGQAVGQVPADKREALARDLQAEVRKFYEDISPMLRAAAIKLAPEALGGVYEERFSEDELKALIAWLESPVNKKFQEVAGELQQSLAQKLVDESKSQIEPKLRALQLTIGNKLNAAAGPTGAKPTTKK